MNNMDTERRFAACATTNLSYNIDQGCSQVQAQIWGIVKPID